ncbi:LacI family DNA-binding transcriptional regulator [Saccharothrix obliqua]|uniref:LacI family DNA-binding transcriptional regulator n=1 Tax=Saccharothrix obliqua TaxID=2861747 RepID=UPI001C5D8372|nr:LacI family DNA-binding transcriptional regulator [Saccharothrix obliqua]MBW4721202.1 LacI family transcriptional regulator [Saccharothrix obliqua]
MSDVARAAGVSAATVSRALRGEPGVSEATRRYVTEVAKRMRYAIARDASSLAGGRRYAVAVLTADVGRGDLLAGAEGALRAAGYDVLLYVLRDADARARFFDELPPLGRRVDGVLALSAHLTDDERAALDALSAPVVEVRDDDLGDALRLAAGHLRELGHREVALVLAEDVDEPYGELLTGAGLAVRPEWTLWSSPTVAGGEQVADALLDGDRLPSAVVCANGEVALGVFLRLRRDRRDVSVVGLDGSDLARAVGLTAVEPAWRELGEHAVGALLAGLRGESHDVPPPPPRLVVRESTSRPDRELPPTIG